MTHLYPWMKKWGKPWEPLSLVNQKINEVPLTHFSNSDMKWDDLHFTIIILKLQSYKDKWQCIKYVRGWNYMMTRAQGNKIQHWISKHILGLIDFIHDEAQAIYTLTLNNYKEKNKMIIHIAVSLFMCISQYHQFLVYHVAYLDIFGT